jgi:cation transport ATPase
MKMNGEHASERGAPAAIRPRKLKPDAIHVVKRRAAGQSRGVSVTICSTVLAVTGVVLAVFRFVVPSDDPFTAYPHPTWPFVMATHVLTTPIFFFLVGSMWWPHVVRHWKNRERRTSGMLVIATAVVVSVSGYALFYVGVGGWAEACRIVHAGTGVVATAVYSYHAVTGWRLVKARRDSSAS